MEEFNKVWDLTVRDLVKIAVDVRKGKARTDATFRDLVDRELSKRGYVADGKDLDAVVAIMGALLNVAEGARREKFAEGVWEAEIAKMEGNVTSFRITDGDLAGTVIRCRMPIPDLEFEE